MVSLYILATIIVTFSNVILSSYIYIYLSTQKKLSKKMLVLKEITMYYSIGMMVALIASIFLFAATG